MKKKSLEKKGRGIPLLPPHGIPPTPFLPKSVREEILNTRLLRGLLPRHHAFMNIRGGNTSRGAEMLAQTLAKPDNAEWQRCKLLNIWSRREDLNPRHLHYK